MEVKKYNRFNFHKHTFCEFREVNSDSLNELKLDYTSKSGSSYYFTEEGVFRVSNHWGRAANCRWRLISKEEKVNQYKRVGFAKWTDFFPNNETERLFYIEINWEDKSVTFQHKSNSKFDGKSFLRTAKEVSKAIQEVNILLNSDDWAKYLEFEEIESLRLFFLEKIVYFGGNLNELKRTKYNYNGK